MSSELSYQQLDPVGGYSTRPVTVIMSSGIALYALLATIFGGGVTSPVLAVASVLLFASSAAGIIYWSNPLRAPFSRGGFLAVMGCATAGLVAGAIATWGNQPNGALGPVAVALIILQLSPYRPVRDLLAATLLTSIVAAFVVILRPGIASLDKPVSLTVIDSVIVLLAIGLASLAYASDLARQHARRTAVEPDPQTTALLRDGITRSVQHDRISILNRSVVPFLSELLQSEQVTQADRDRALVIADSIRSLMVADVERSWLDNVIEHLGDVSATGGADASATGADGMHVTAVPLTGAEVVQDDDRVANTMTSKQRSVLRALLAALFAHPGFDPDGFGILIVAEDDDTCVFTLTAKLDGEESMLRSGLGAYFAALRIMFTDLEIEFESPMLTLRFSYDHL